MNLVSIEHTGTHTLLEIFQGQDIDQYHFPNVPPCGYTNTIAPVRHPREVALSWKRRGRDLSELPELWDQLIAYRAIYLPVERLSIVRRGLEHQEPATLTVEEERMVGEILEKHREFFERFYG